MPPLNTYECDKCGFCLTSGWTDHRYVVNQEGERVICGHPLEYLTINKVLGENAPQWLINEKIGVITHCVCMDCFNKFYIDIEQDNHMCPTCLSSHIATYKEIPGKTCPERKDGTIKKNCIAIS